MAEFDNSAHVQARFHTQEQEYAVPDDPFSLSVDMGIIELNSIINSLLHPDSPESEHIQFDILINGEFLQNTIKTYIDQNNVSTESVLEIEYQSKNPAPEPEDSLLHDDWVSAVRALEDYILTGSYDNAVRIWSTEGDILTTIPGHSAPVKCVAWIQNDEENPVKRFVTGSHDETVLMWEWNQQKNSVDCVHSCRGHAGSVDTVAVDPTKSRFCSGAWDKMLKVWSAVPNPEEDHTVDEKGEKPSKKKKTDGSKVATRVPIVTFSGHNEGISSALWLSDTEICTASWDHSIKVWDLEQTAQKSSLSGSKAIFNIAYSPLNRLIVAASADRHVRIYDPQNTDGAIVKGTYTSHSAWVSSVAWSPVNDKQFISGSYDMLIKLWDLRNTKSPLYDLGGHQDKILALDWTMPQYMMSGGADNHLKIFKYARSGRRGSNAAAP